MIDPTDRLPGTLQVVACTGMHPIVHMGAGTVEEDTRLRSLTPTSVTSHIINDFNCNSSILLFVCI